MIIITIIVKRRGQNHLTSIKINGGVPAGEEWFENLLVKFRQIVVGEINFSVIEIT